MSTVASFYRFFTLENPELYLDQLLEWGLSRSLKGTILLAAEGINANLWGAEANLPIWIDELEQLFAQKFDVKYTSTTTTEPFHKWQVRVKKEILTFLPLAASAPAGVSLSPEDWDEYLTSQEAVLLDVRNHYEHTLGHFESAVGGNMAQFTDFPDMVKAIPKEKPVLMYCTGGIRCEKASAWMLSHGWSQVFQLEGGILNYLAVTKNQKQHWKGDCFVFDHRRGVQPDLSPVS